MAAGDGPSILGALCQQVYESEEYKRPMSKEITMEVRNGIVRRGMMFTCSLRQARHLLLALPASPISLPSLTGQPSSLKQKKTMVLRKAEFYVLMTVKPSLQTPLMSREPSTSKCKWSSHSEPRVPRTFSFVPASAPTHTVPPRTSPSTTSSHGACRPCGG